MKGGIGVVLQKIRQSPSQIFIWILVWFVVGTAVASIFYWGRDFLFPIYLGLMALAVLLVLFWQKKEIRLILLGGFFLFLGAGRFVLSEPSLTAGNLRFYNGRWLEIEAEVVEEVKIKSGRQEAVAESRKIKIANLETLLGRDLTVRGRAVLYLPPYPQYRYGDQLEIFCQLSAPRQLENFDYPAYLAKEGVWSVCQNPRIKKIGDGGGWLKKPILEFKSLLAGQVSRILPEPQASFLGGLLYGARSAMPADLLNVFNRVGLTHIVAISGYNISIIAAALLAILKGLWIPRKKAFWLAVLGIVFFVFLTGAGAPVARAGIMGIVALLARHWGRSAAAARLLLLAGVLMLAFNPRVLFFDVGFQLSFVSTAGLVYFAPLLEKFFWRVPAIFGLKEAVLTTFSAIIATLPLVLHQFGRFSLIAPLANVLILPVIPLTMALGFGAIILSFIYWPLGQIAGWLVWLPLTYIIRTAEFLSSFGWASIAAPSLPWWAMAAMYGAMIYAVGRIKRRQLYDIANLGLPSGAKPPRFPLHDIAGFPTRQGAKQSDPP